MCPTFFEIFKFFYGFNRVEGSNFRGFFVDLMSQIVISSRLMSQIVTLKICCAGKICIFATQLKFLRRNQNINEITVFALVRMRYN